MQAATLLGMDSSASNPAHPRRRRPFGLVAAALVVVLVTLEVIATSAVSAALAITPARIPGAVPVTGLGTRPAPVMAAAPAAVMAPTAAVVAPTPEAAQETTSTPDQTGIPRAASPWLRLAAEEPSFLQATRSAAQALEQLQSVEPAPVADEAPSDPPPADAGDETTAAAGGLAGAGRAAAVVPNRLRIPSLAISQTIRQFPCDRSQPPDNFVYQWGCAGRNNLYLLGHAYSVFAPLHDAYAAGQLQVGMLATFTGADGAVQTYRVTTWRLVRPDQTAWAVASQPVPSMTLQTCYGSNSELRLLVRLVLAG